MTTTIQIDGIEKPAPDVLPSRVFRAAWKWGPDDSVEIDIAKARVVVDDWLKQAILVVSRRLLEAVPSEDKAALATYQNNCERLLINKASGRIDNVTTLEALRNPLDPLTDETPVSKLATLDPLNLQPEEGIYQHMYCEMVEKGWLDQIFGDIVDSETVKPLEVPEVGTFALKSVANLERLFQLPNPGYPIVLKDINNLAVQLADKPSLGVVIKAWVSRKNQYESARNSLLGDLTKQAKILRDTSNSNDQEILTAAETLQSAYEQPKAALDAKVTQLYSA